MFQGDMESKPIPTKWKKRTAPEYIRPCHVLPAFSHPPDSQPVCWDFPPQETNVVQLRTA